MIKELIKKRKLSSLPEAINLEGHITYIVISKDQLSVWHYDTNAELIDFNNFSYIIALLRYDCKNGLGFHYNHFVKLGMYDYQLEPISQIPIRKHKIIEVVALRNKAEWGYFRVIDAYENVDLIEISNNGLKEL